MVRPTEHLSSVQSHHSQQSKMARRIHRCLAQPLLEHSAFSLLPLSLFPSRTFCFLTSSLFPSRTFCLLFPSRTFHSPSPLLSSYIYSESTPAHCTSQHTWISLMLWCHTHHLTFVLIRFVDSSVCVWLVVSVVAVSLLIWCSQSYISSSLPMRTASQVFSYV